MASIQSLLLLGSVIRTLFDLYRNRYGAALTLFAFPAKPALHIFLSPLSS